MVMARPTVRRLGSMAGGAALLLLALATAPACSADAGISPEASAAAHRTVLLDLGVRPDGTREDFLLTERLLGVVQDSSAQPVAERSRLAAMAAWRAGDRAALLAHSRRVLKLDPNDTVALLRVITEQVAELQTVEERLRALEGLIGERGAGIDPSVRSRLAVDAALLRRELGENDASLRLIGEALRLDPSNKPAAALLVREVESRTDDPLARLEAQIALLMADPIDPHVHGAIAYALSSHGAYRSAARFMNNSATLAAGQGIVSRTRLREELVLSWLIESPEVVLKRLTLELTAGRAQAEALLERARELDEPTDGLKAPEDVRLDLSTEELRLAAALSIGDEDVIRASLTEMSATLDQTLAEQRERVLQLPEAEQAQILGSTLGVLTRMHMCRFLAGIDMDLSREQMGQMVARVPPARNYFSQLEPLILLRSGEPEQALTVADEFDGFSMPIQIALVEIHAELGNTELAIDAAQHLADRAVHVGWGAWAVDRARQIDPSYDPLSPVGVRLRERAGQVPAWIERLIIQPSSAIALRVQPLATSYDAGEPVRMRIEMTNLAPVPLGFGSDRTISSRLLITPDLDDDSRGFVGSPQSAVIETDRRLRLRARESIAFVVDADSPYTDWLIGCNADITTRQRWRALQDFRIGRRNLPVKGPVALSTETPVVYRSAIPEAHLSADELAERIAQAADSEPAGVPRDLLVAARAVLFDADTARAAGLVSVLIDAFDGSDASGRALMLCELPTRSMTFAMDPFDAHVLDVVGKDPAGFHPLVVAMTMLTRAIDPADPLLQAAAELGGSLADASAIINGRLSRNEITYASARGGAEAVAGPTQSRLREIVRQRLQEDR